MRKFSLLFSVLCFIALAVNAANNQPDILSEDFSSLTAGANNSTSGPSGTLWTGNTNFPTTVKAYPAGGVVKLGSSSGAGSLTSKSLDLSVNGGVFNISFDIKGWSSIEGSIKVTVTGLATQTVTYTALVDAASMENKVLSFTGGTANSTVTIETTAKRAFIDNVRVFTPEPNCTASSLAFATSPVLKTIGDAAFTQTATSLNQTTPINYSSSASAVATVNATTGEVSVVGVGTTTITATQAAGTHNSVDYCATTANYTLNVLAVPTVTVTDVYSPAMATAVGVPTSQTILIGGIRLTDANGISLALSGTNKNYFALSTNTIAQAGGNAASTCVTVTYTPTVAGTHSATLVLSSASAPDVTINLNGQTTTTGLVAPTLPLAISIVNYKLQFTAKAGESINIYNAAGQQLFNKTATNGLNTVELPGHGVFMVQVNNRLAKVIN